MFETFDVEICRKGLLFAHLFDEGVEAGGGEVGGVLVEIEAQCAAGGVFAAAVGGAAFEDVALFAQRAGDLLEFGYTRFA